MSSHWDREAGDTTPPPPERWVTVLMAGGILVGVVENAEDASRVVSDAAKLGINVALVQRRLGMVTLPYLSFTAEQEVPRGS